MHAHRNTYLQTLPYMFLRPDRLDSRVFVLHGAARIPPFQPCIRTVERQPIASFVAQGPYDDTGVVFVPLHHPPHPGQMSRFEGWLIG